MFGVVLWSDQSDRKAVIWCEDQGDLAYFKCVSQSAEDNIVFDAGDLVQFDVHVENATRRAQNPRLVIEKVATALPKVLRAQTPTPEKEKPRTAQVIPFNLRATNGTDFPERRVSNTKA
ncbi:MAG: hypothetical protein WBC93_07630 [Sulfitobacter sp.]